jgi:hypothetical protein
MTRRASGYHTSSLNGLTMRAGRAAEDPAEMTAPATMTRMAKYVAAVLKENPDLTAEQAAKGAVLKLRADMGQLARRSADARRACTSVAPAGDAA